MKLQCAFVLLFLISVVTAQDGEAAPKERRCITGYSVNGNGNFTTSVCSSSEDSCQTQIVRNGLFITTFKRCKEMHACKNNELSNKFNCYGNTAYTNDVHVCCFCCQGDVCNTMDNIPNLDMSRKEAAKQPTFEGSA